MGATGNVAAGVSPQELDSHAFKVWGMWIKLKSILKSGAIYVDDPGLYRELMSKQETAKWMLMNSTHLSRSR